MSQWFRTYEFCDILTFVIKHGKWVTENGKTRKDVKRKQAYQPQNRHHTVVTDTFTYTNLGGMYEAGMNIYAVHVNSLTLDVTELVRRNESFAFITQNRIILSL
jgi:hypothetical protein